MDYHNFATRDKPIRCSKLASIAKCSIRIWMIGMIDCEDDEGSPAAQTGSLTHAGVAAFHKTQDKTLAERKKAAWDAIALNRTLFPVADETEVRLFITPYMDDPRNITANCVAVETGVEFELPPHELDPTGKPIFVQGTFDQLRMDEHGNVRLYDLKTGKKTGWEMIHDYAVQLAAYTYGCKQNPEFDRIKPGYIIRNYTYRMRDAVLPSPQGVFWSMPYQTMEQIDWLLSNVRLHVALIRSGYMEFNPGPHCTYCEFGGLANCMPRYEELQLKMK